MLVRKEIVIVECDTCARRAGDIRDGIITELNDRSQDRNVECDIRDRDRPLDVGKDDKLTLGRQRPSDSRRASAHLCPHCSGVAS